MILPDVNVLLNAYRPDASEHALCRRWLTGFLGAPGPFGVSPLALSAVIRIATSRRVFDPPSDVADAIGFCEDLLSHPNAVVVQAGAGHWPIFTDLCRRHAVSGPLVTDAWFAALAIEHGCEWITLDKDFARFSGLRWSRPE